MSSSCKFYELDKLAKEEYEAEISAYRESIGEEAFLAEQEFLRDIVDSTGSGGSNLTPCTEFCKYFAGDKGYPGEYVYHCKCPGHERVLEIDFNENEVI